MSRTYLWWLLLAALLTAQLVFPRVNTTPPDGVASVGEVGQRAFFLVVQERLPVATRTAEPIADLLASRRVSNQTARTALLMLSPTRLPTEPEWQALLKFVFQGGSVLLALPPVEEDTLIEPLGVEVVPQAFADDYPDSVLMQTDEVLWLTDQYLNPAPEVRSEWETLVTLSGTVQASRKRFGRGQLVLVADSFVFTNQSLAWGENGVMAFRLVEALGATAALREVFFDESLNTEKVPRVMAILLDLPFRPLTLHLMLVAVFFGWRGSLRFGPRLPEAVAPRRGLTDHTDAVGNLYYQSGDGKPLLRSYLKRVKDALGRSRDPRRLDRTLAQIADRLDVDVPRLKRLLQAAERAAESDRVKARPAATLLRSLARLRKAIGVRH